MNFTGEDETMFKTKKLPTLDTELWFEDGQIKHQFFEKPTVGNRVLMADTALPADGLKATLIQEVVRRLENCSIGIDVQVTDRILSEFAQKLINSGHTMLYTKITLVQGVSKYLDNLRLSKLSNEILTLISATK